MSSKFPQFVYCEFTFNLFSIKSMTLDMQAKETYLDTDMSLQDHKTSSIQKVGTWQHTNKTI